MAVSLRFGLLLSLLTAACGSATAPDDPSSESACDPARRVHAEALSEALGQAPPCESSADCVAMENYAACEGLVEIEGCDLAVHRKVLELYDPEDVSERMCEAAGNAKYGCSVSVSCVPHGEPLCRAGACVFNDHS